MRSRIEFEEVDLSKAVPELSCYQQGEFVRKLEDGYRPEEIIAQARLDWNRVMAEVNLAVEVPRIIVACERGASRDEIKTMLRNIKLLRKPGTRLVDIHKLVLATHKAPATLSQLVDAIGDFKDFAFYPERVRAAGETLLRLSMAYAESKDEESEYADFASFWVTYQKYLSDIIGLLEMEYPTMHFFHKLRFRVRTLRHYFSVLGLATGNKQAMETSRLLGPVSEEMGKIQDVVIKMRVRGEIDIYSDVTEVPEIHRQIIETFLALHN